jgi:uncharacterized protein
MLDHLPHRIDPYEFVEKKRRIKGKLPFAGMDRLRDVVLNLDDAASVELEFSRQGRVAAIKGWIEATLVLQCQVCLEALDWPVASEVHLGVVGTIDEADTLSEPFEPLLVEADSPVELADIIQDELLLALPAVPQHADCRLSKAEVKAEGRKHPFAALAQFKKPNP